MKLIHALAATAAMVFAACQSDSLQDNSDPVNTPSTGATSQPIWQSIPEGKSFLVNGATEKGDPIYVPVTFSGDKALVEGDIVIAQGQSQIDSLKARLVDPKQQPKVLAKTSGFYVSSALPTQAKAWPGASIPFEISAGISDVDKRTILSAIFQFNQNSPVSYVPWDNSDVYRVQFVPATEAVSSSQVGMQAVQPQAINIVGNVTEGVVMHEMGHAAGLYHEHTRPDRGQYVSIASSGTDPDGELGRDYNINYDGTQSGVYDFKSLMHYSTWTRQVQNSDGTYLYIQIVAINGTVVDANNKLSAGDRTALWELQVNADPLVVQTRLKSTGKINKLFTMYNTASNHSNNMLTNYDPATGYAQIYWVVPGGYLVSKDYQFVGYNYTQIIPVKYGKAGSRKYSLMFYNKNDGGYRNYNISELGILGSQAEIGTLPVGYDDIEAYQSGLSGFYLYLHNTTTGQVKINQWNTNGTLGATTYSATWGTDWIFSKPFFIETTPYLSATYFLFRSKSGLSRIRAMPENGSLGTLVMDKTFLPSYNIAGVYQGVTSAFLVISGSKALYIYEMDASGFRDDARLYRVGSTSRTVSKFDATTDIEKPWYAPGGAINGKFYNYSSQVSLVYQDLPNYCYFVKLAPFH